jgi:hypothetical protein
MHSCVRKFFFTGLKDQDNDEGMMNADAAPAMEKGQVQTLGRARQG